jgi:5'-nucleotidase / UDP-sugar diphosphatase
MSGQSTRTVTILHTNDFHGRHQAVRVIKGNATAQTGDPGRDWDEFEREGLAGGFPALATAVNRFREQRGAENVVLVDAGDAFGDDLLGNLTEGEAVVRLMNTTGYQMMALGNHDFDYGKERTRALQEIAAFPMRGANVILRESGKPFLGDPTLIVEAGGARIGFLLLGYHNTAQTGNPKNLAGLAFESGVDAARRHVPGLSQRADVVVVVSHQGTAMDRVLAQEVAGIDVIIGGHSHDRISVEWVRETAIVQAVSDSTVLGELVISVEDKRVAGLEHRLHTLWLDAFPPDEKVARQVETLRAPFRHELEDVIATAAEPIGRNYRSESPFDKLVGQMMMEETGAEIAFMPGVGYGVTLLPGPISREALYALIPHPAKLVTMKLSGRQVLEILEQSAANQKPAQASEKVGRLVQTAGLSWTVDLRQPAGERVSAVRVIGQPLEPEWNYRIATNAGMARGLHNYTAFTDGRDVKEHDVQVNELVEKQMRERGTVYAPRLGDIILEVEN